MDFEALLSQYNAKACILSLELHKDGTYGNIRVAAGNKAHCDDMASLKHCAFVPDTPYEMWFVQNKVFEDSIFRCVTGEKPIHAYVNLYMLGLWLDMYLLPLTSDREGIGYCLYCYDVSPDADCTAMTDISPETAANVLNTCVKLRRTDNIRQTFQDVVVDLGQMCGSDHCCILLVDTEQRHCSVFGEALREGSGLLPMTNYVDDKFYEIVETWPALLAGGTCVIIKDQCDMEKLRERNPLWAASLSGAGAKSIVLFPLLHNCELLGYVWAINFNVENVVRIKETLELTTFFLASELANYKLVQKLEILGSIDTLTGIKNRNMMNDRIDRIAAGEAPVPYAVVFADLNGLKRINDELGHSAGDQMLHAAASILQGVFYDEEVYRAGGDEFMLFVDNITEAELEKRIEQVCRRAEETEDIRFSIGVCCGEPDIRNAMRIADRRMYAVKKAYYAEHPEMKYR